VSAARTAPGGVEIEGFGVSYDRHMLYHHQRLLVRELGLGRVLEMPSHGAKAAGSLYSVGFATAGCDVTLTDMDEKMRRYWRRLGIEPRLAIAPLGDYGATPFADGQFDLAWNFVTFTELKDKAAYVAEMARVSSRFVLLVACNNLQAGYPLHRAIHKAWGFPWTHGETRYNYPWEVLGLMRRAGLRIREAGTIDSPPWPDPVGFRDVRLHKRGASRIPFDWEVPAMEHIERGRFPAWMALLRAYDLRLRRGWLKLAFSHLFYVLGEKC
jgi:hypothetical protein